MPLATCHMLQATSYKLHSVYHTILFSLELRLLIKNVQKASQSNRSMHNNGLSKNRLCKHVCAHVCVHIEACCRIQCNVLAVLQALGTHWSESNRMNLLNNMNVEQALQPDSSLSLSLSLSLTLSFSRSLSLWSSLSLVWPCEMWKVKNEKLIRPIKWHHQFQSILHWPTECCSICCKSVAQKGKKKKRNPEYWTTSENINWQGSWNRSLHVLRAKS